MFFKRKGLPYRTSRQSWILVGIQVACLVFLVFSAPSTNERLDLLIWELAGIGLAGMALFGLNWHSFSVFPEPRPEARLVTTGIYAYLRHPMYSGVLLIFGTLVLGFFSPWRLLVWVILLVVFLIKIKKEEAFLAARFPEYPSYQLRTNRLIPYIW